MGRRPTPKRTVLLHTVNSQPAKTVPPILATQRVQEF
uniref:Uncharacterized protein n=1 Tax=Anguilla anguilla TaxID=7936 RepID=A0A0E9UIN2_ANGAN